MQIFDLSHCRHSRTVELEVRLGLKRKPKDIERFEKIPADGPGQDHTPNERAEAIAGNKGIKLHPRDSPLRFLLDLDNNFRLSLLQALNLPTDAKLDMREVICGVEKIFAIVDLVISISFEIPVLPDGNLANSRLESSRKLIPASDDNLAKLVIL
ncbi:MAG: hypothetical protein Q9170_001140 [Blastenia crenularia]